MPRFGRSFPMRNARLSHKLAASPISSTLTAPYAVTGSVAQTLRTPYGMGGSVNSTLRAPYNLTTAVAQTRIMKWGATGAVAGTIRVAWINAGSVAHAVRLLWIAQSGVTFTLTDDFTGLLGKLTLAYGMPLGTFAMGVGGLTVFTTSDVALTAALRQLAADQPNVLREGV